MTKSEVETQFRALEGERVKFKCWDGGIISGKIMCRFAIFSQIAYVQGSRWAYPEPYIYSLQLRWFPSWRIVRRDK